MPKLIAVLLMLVLLSGCGFALRGAYKLPVEMQTTYVAAGSVDVGLSRRLIRRLKASDINVISSESENAAVLTLFKPTKSKRIVSVDSKGRAREYTLTYGVTFSVQAQQGAFEIEDQAVRIDRDFIFDSEDVLGNSREESKLYEEMQLDIIRLIMLRLQSRT